jgi:hypothetical protein
MGLLNNINWQPPEKENKMKNYTCIKCGCKTDDDGFHFCNDASLKKEVNMNNAQKFLLDYKCGNLILNRVNESEDRIYASDIMEQYLKSAISELQAEHKKELQEVRDECDVCKYKPQIVDDKYDRIIKQVWIKE